MLDLGWAELMFLAVLALVVVGPQDLPKLARTQLLLPVLLPGGATPLWAYSPSLPYSLHRI